MRVAYVIFLYALASVFAADCPRAYPYAYRPRQNFDYCCKTDLDRNGLSRTAGGSADLSSCEGNQFKRCPGGSGCLNNDIVKPNACPKTHPFVYREAYGYDYCCQSDKDSTGKPRSWDGADKNSCMANKYAKCPTGRGCIDYVARGGDGESCTFRHECESDVCFSGECVVDPQCAIGDKKGGIRQFGGQDACISAGNGLKYCSADDTTCCYPGVEIVWNDAGPDGKWHCGLSKDGEFCKEKSECESNICFKGVCVADPPCVVFGQKDRTGQAYGEDRRGGVRKMYGTEYCISNGNGVMSCGADEHTKCCSPGATLVKSDDGWECQGTPDMYDLNAGGACKPGFSPLTSSWQDCEAAGKVLGFTGDSVRHVAYDASRRWGTSKPQGCYHSKNNGRIHFNRAAGGVDVPDDILCKRDPAPEKPKADLGWCPSINNYRAYDATPLARYKADPVANTIEKCQAKCDATDTCDVLIWDPTQIRCWLFGETGFIRIPPGKSASVFAERTCMFKFCGDFHEYSGKCTSTSSKKQRSMKTDKKTRSECEEHCLAEPGCRAYEWNTASEKCDILFGITDGGDGNSDVECHSMGRRTGGNAPNDELEEELARYRPSAVYAAEGIAFQEGAGGASKFTIVHLLAAFGLAVTAYGAFRHYIK